jgi:prepilin-type N-terminal cleavage/methylation domain-containing protein
MRKTRSQAGFSLVEVLVGIFLLAVAVLGLAQLFLAAVANNLKGDRVANATFLAQQQIDWLRGFTLDELTAFSGTSLESRDEVIDINVDGVNDFRRITEFTENQDVFQVRVSVYSAEKIALLTATDLLADPVHHRPRAQLATIITR